MLTLPKMTDAEMTAFNIECFNAWMKKVDAVLIAKTGLSNSDLPDWTYFDAFEDGATPASAAKQAIKAAKEDF